MVISNHDTQSAQISQKQVGRNTYAIIKTICPPGYHHSGFEESHRHQMTQNMCPEP